MNREGASEADKGWEKQLAYVDVFCFLHDIKYVNQYEIINGVLCTGWT